MAENLNYDTEGAVCYDYKKSNCDKYGRLYNWESAMRACPSGWHLPSDAEWKNLAKTYGGYKDNLLDNKITGNPQSTFQSLIDGGSSGFSVLLGGNYYPGAKKPFYFLERFGSYWTTTKHAHPNWNKPSAIKYSFIDDKNLDDRPFLTRDYMTKTVFLSCLCVKD